MDADKENVAPPPGTSRRPPDCVGKSFLVSCVQLVRHLLESFSAGCRAAADSSLYPQADGTVVQQHCSMVARPGGQAEYANTTIRYLADGTWQTWMTKTTDWRQSRQPLAPPPEPFPLSSVTLPLVLTNELTSDPAPLSPPCDCGADTSLSPTAKAFVASLLQTPPTKKQRI